jgi:hypothetical protein
VWFFIPLLVVHLVLVEVVEVSAEAVEAGKNLEN